MIRRRRRDATVETQQVDVASRLGVPGVSGGPATVTPLSSRAAAQARLSRVERRRRARRRRARLVAVLAATVLVVLAAAAGLWWLVALRGATPKVAGAARPAAAGTTVLLEVVGAGGTAFADAVLAHAPGPGSSVMLVPTPIIVDVAGAGSMSLAQAAALPAGSASANALTDLLELRLDGSWRLTSTGLARLVDSLGPIQVDVDRDVLAARPSGATVVVVPAGPQRLNGTAAAAYAAYLAPGEPEQARMARVKEVLQAVLAALPADPAVTSQRLSGLGAASRSTLPDLVALLEQLRADARQSQIAYDVLPTQALDTGSGAESLSVDDSAAPAVLRRLFPEATRPSGAPAPVSVLVQNGVGTPGLGETARTKLVADGFHFIAGGNAAAMGQAKTIVIIADTSPSSIAVGARVAAALGVPDSDVRVAAQQQNVADVLVILGRDFRP